MRLTAEPQNIAAWPLATASPTERLREALFEHQGEVEVASVSSHDQSTCIISRCEPG